RCLMAPMPDAGVNLHSDSVLCPYCEYDLRASTTLICPECGREVPLSLREESSNRGLPWEQSAHRSTFLGRYLRTLSFALRHYIQYLKLLGAREGQPIRRQWRFLSMTVAF